MNILQRSLSTNCVLAGKGSRSFAHNNNKEAEGKTLRKTFGGDRKEHERYTNPHCKLATPPSKKTTLPLSISCEHTGHKLMQSNLKELLSSTTVAALTGDRGLFDVDKDLTIGDTLKVCPNPHKGFFFWNQNHHPTHNRVFSNY